MNLKDQISEVPLDQESLTKRSGSTPSTADELSVMEPELFSPALHELLTSQPPSPSESIRQGNVGKRVFAL